MAPFEPAAGPWRLLAAALMASGIGLAVFGQAPEPLGSSPGADTVSFQPPDTVTIAVLNGSGCDGFAGQVKRFLESQDGPTVFISPGPESNAASVDGAAYTYEETIFVSHVPGLEAALAVIAPISARTGLEIGEESVVWEIRQPSPVDVSIFLGRDLGEIRDSLIPTL
ncbi:hypothetical protein GX411_08845 [Candidatus Fermentibacteria bacterium]|nr:hypothetical protein [Candidatus Fermentibacteria bacterium]